MHAEIAVPTGPHNTPAQLPLPRNPDSHRIGPQLLQLRLFGQLQLRSDCIIAVVSLSFRMSLLG